MGLKGPINCVDMQRRRGARGGGAGLVSVDSLSYAARLLRAYAGIFTGIVPRFWLDSMAHAVGTAWSRARPVSSAVRRCEVSIGRGGCFFEGGGLRYMSILFSSPIDGDGGGAGWTRREPKPSSYVASAGRVHAEPCGNPKVAHSTASWDARAAAHWEGLRGARRRCECGRHVRTRQRAPNP